MTRSKSRRTRRNRRRRGGHNRDFAGAEGWITAENHLTDLTTPGGCAMMLGKRGTLWGRSGMGGEYGKIASGKMKGYDGKTKNKIAMMNFNLGCDKGNGESQVILANERMEDRKKYGINDVNISKKKLMELFKKFDWATRKKFLEEGTQDMRENEKFKNFAVAAAPQGAAGLKNQYVRDDHGNATLGGSRRRRRKKSRRKRKKSRRKRKKSRKRRRRR